MYGHRRVLTIIRDQTSRPDAQALSLAVLSWIVEDARRRERFLALTGLTPDDLRQRLQDPAVLVAVLDFVLGHESDLIAAAADLAVPPQSIADARLELTA